MTAVWGDWHTNALVDVNLPSLLAPGNIPELAKHHDIVYVISTRESDRARIESAPAFKRLRQLIDARIATTLPEENEGSIFAVHHDVWTEAQKQATRERAFVLNLPPDVVFADGAGATMCRLIERQKKSILWMYSRAVAETIVPALRERFASPTGVMAIPPRELVALNLRHLHSLAMSCFAESPYFVKHPEIVLWPVKGEGLLVRVLAHVNALYEPAHFKLTENYLLEGEVNFDDLALVDDSDDIFAISLTPFGKDFEWHLYPRQADPVRIARWWLHYDSEANDFMLRHQLRFHIGEPTEALWRQREHRANLLLSRAVAAREALRIWRVAWDAGHSRVAGLIAAVAETHALLRAFPRHIDALVFGPSDAALDRLPWGPVEDLLAPENADRLLWFMRSHVVVNEHPRVPLGDRIRDAGGVLALRSLTGGEVVLTRDWRGRLMVNGMLAHQQPLRAGKHTFLPIEFVLDDGYSSQTRFPAARPTCTETVEHRPPGQAQP